MCIKIIVYPDCNIRCENNRTKDNLMQDMFVLKSRRNGELLAYKVIKALKDLPSDNYDKIKIDFNLIERIHPVAAWGFIQLLFDDYSPEYIYSICKFTNRTKQVSKMLLNTANRYQSLVE